MEWIIPCNMQKYNVIGAFSKLDKISWKQSTNINEGDTVYIYISGEGFKCIMYKTLATAVNQSQSNINDDEFVIDGTLYNNYGRYMELEKINMYHRKLLIYENLREHGLKSVQGPTKVSDELSDYINMLDEFSFHNLEVTTDSFIRMKTIHKDFLEDFTKFNKSKSKTESSGKASSYYNHLIRLLIGYNDKFNFKNANLYKKENMVFLKNLLDDKNFKKFNRYTSNFYSATINSYDKFISSDYSGINIISSDNYFELGRYIYNKINSNRNYKPDYKELNEEKEAIGKAGEKIALEFEYKRLKKESIDCIPEQVSLYDDGKGYDIKSKSIVNNQEVDRFIEVKSTTDSFVNKLKVHITHNELEFAQANNEYYLYLVSDIHKKNPKVEVFPNPFKKDNINDYLKPVEYKMIIVRTKSD